MKESGESFWDRVKGLLSERKIRQEQLADMIGAQLPTMKQQIFHGRYPSACDVVKISRILNAPVEWLVYGEGPSSMDDRFYVPVLNQKLSAGKGQEIVDSEVAGYMEVPKNLRHYGEKLLMLYVEGDSMEPTLRRGDAVLCDSCGYDGEGLYAVQYDGEAFVKRVSRTPGKFVIKSDNPLYPPMEEPVGSDCIAIVGRIHYIVKKCD